MKENYNTHPATQLQAPSTMLPVSLCQETQRSYGLFAGSLLWKTATTNKIMSNNTANVMCHHI